MIEEIEGPAITTLSWEDVEIHIPEAAEDIRVMAINGTSGDVLAYEGSRETGLNAIVIGGDKLSRGLTLENLTVSYFLRASRMYDTLMQMGRWFGYRPGFLDLCRLYTTRDLHGWFEHITEASEELRQEFDHMARVGGTPRDYGLKVKSHPALLVTSQVKMRNGMDMQLSYAGSISETTVFHRSAEHVRRNFEAALQLVQRLGGNCIRDIKQQRGPDRSHTWSGSCVWLQVPHTEILGFLDAVITHVDAPKANAALLREYIALQAGIGELTHWTVALLSGLPTAAETQLGGHAVRMVRRNPRDAQSSQDDRYVIRRLVNPRDEAIDLGPDDFQQALDQTIQDWRAGLSRSREEPTEPSGPNLRGRRAKEKGLLLLYPLEPADVEGDLPVIGFGISFPASENARTVHYRVNNIYWQQEIEDLR